jgi:hypothetical protein
MVFKKFENFWFSDDDSLSKYFYFFLKMWKILIHRQNYTKHKVGPNLYLGPPLFLVEKGRERLLKVETLAT